MATDSEIEAAAKKLYEWHGVKSMVDAREMAREAMEAAEKEYSRWAIGSLVVMTDEQIQVAKSITLAFNECDMNRNNPPALRSAIDSLEQRIAKLRELLIAG